MITVCIFDDEPALRRELRNMLQQYSVHQELEIFEISTIPELLGNTSHYDVLFLDIRFDGEDAGVEAAKQLRKKGSEAIIVFLTSLSQYATPYMSIPSRGASRIAAPHRVWKIQSRLTPRRLPHRVWIFR